MRIALVSTLRTSVPPVKSGSVELIVALMAEELARRGHEVTVFGTGDSGIGSRVRVVSVLPTGYHHDPTVWDWRFAEFMQLGRVYEEADDFDVIHSHVYCYALPFTRLVATPTVHTFHTCPTPDFVRVCRRYPDGQYVILTEFQRRFCADIPVAAVIPNGIATSAFPFNPDRGHYLAYLGDFRPDKGPLEAIHLARAAGIPIRLAGPASPYFHAVIEPEVDGRTVEYVGEVDHPGKCALLGGALALVFLAQGLEACPLVLMEAMACGTPILSSGAGPMPEIATPGVGGLHVEDPRQLRAALDRIVELDRRAVRRLAVERFDVARMVDDYLELFTRVVERPDPQPAPTTWPGLAAAGPAERGHDR